MRNLQVLILLFCLTFLSSCTKEKVSEGLICENEVSFSQQVLPLINQYCTGCHTNSNGYNLVDHASIASNANAVVGAMRANGFQLMPQGGPMLEDSLIKIMECWIEQGKPNN